MAAKFIAIVDMVDSSDWAPCPNDNVIAEPRSGYMRLSSNSYDDLMSVLTSFIGMTSAEADILIEEV